MVTAKPSGSRLAPRFVPWLVGAVVVVGALGVAVLVGGGGGDGGSGGGTGSGATTGDGPALVQMAAVKVTGTPLPRLADGADRAVGTVAPTLVGVSFDGSPVAVQPGKPTLVLFLAHWCPHCQREVPELVEHFKAAGRPAGVDVIAVATATSRDSPNYPPSSWLDREGWPTPVLVDSADSAAANAFGLPGFPYLVGLDAAGKVVGRLSGEFSGAQFDALAAKARG